MPQLSNRTATFTDSVIRRMTRISNKYGAVNLSQGFPDFEPPREILDRLAEVTNEDFHQYSIGAVIGILMFLICAFFSLIMYSRMGSTKNEEAFQ